MQSGAASFDCAKAVTPQEKAVCADPELSKLDEQMTAAYQALPAQLSSNAAAEVRNDQREWLRWIPKACPNYIGQEADEFKACLLNEYTSQTDMLKAGLRRIGGIAFFPRVRVAAAPNKADPNPFIRRIDFETLHIDWPEIDRPTPQQAAWNDAVRTVLVDAQQLDTEVRIGIQLSSANQQFISAILDGSIYGYGAAHPNETRKSFNWWMQQSRELKANDVFRSGSSWRKH